MQYGTNACWILHLTIVQYSIIWSDFGFSEVVAAFEAQLLVDVLSVKSIVKLDMVGQIV